MNALAKIPRVAQDIRLPRAFFTDFLPAVSSLSEMKVILLAIYLIQEKKSHPAGITAAELFRYPELKDLLRSDTRAAEDIIQAALEKAVDTEVFRPLNVISADQQEEGYTINTTVTGDTKPSEIPPGNATDIKNKNEINIYTLYEENIGMLTPMILEQLKEAEQIYPPAWITDAFREAASLNKRSWRYIETILERWRLEGKQHGSSGKYTKENDPDKYIKGKYGHIVRR